MKRARLSTAGRFLTFISVLSIGTQGFTAPVSSTQITSNGSAANFIDRVGVNSHGSKADNSYTSASKIVVALDYLGIDNVRDALPDAAGAGRSILESMARSGVRFNFRVNANLPERGSSGMTTYLSSLRAFLSASPGSIRSVEGLNEANVNAFSYNGDSTTRGAAAFQCALYKSVRATSSLKNVAVVNFSIASSTEADFKALGNLDACANAGNIHIYTPAGSTSDKNIKRVIGYARAVVPGDPVYVTEIGHHTLKNVPTVGLGAWAQAKLTLSELLDAYQNGAAMTYMYELFDNDTDSLAGEKEAHFGLFYANGSPKPAGTAVHNMMRILKYGDTGRVDGVVNAKLSIDSEASTVHAVRFEKSASYVIAVWNDVAVWRSSTSEDVVNPVRKTIVKFGHLAKTVRVYDPVKSLKPILKATNSSSVELPLMDRPLVIEINATRDVPAQ